MWLVILTMVGILTIHHYAHHLSYTSAYTLLRIRSEIQLEDKIRAEFVGQEKLGPSSSQVWMNWHYVLKSPLSLLHI